MLVLSLSDSIRGLRPFFRALALFFAMGTATLSTGSVHASGSKDLPWEYVILKPTTGSKHWFQIRKGNYLDEWEVKYVEYEKPDHLYSVSDIEFRDNGEILIQTGTLIEPGFTLLIPDANHANPKAVFKNTENENLYTPEYFISHTQKYIPKIKGLNDASSAKPNSKPSEQADPELQTDWNGKIFAAYKDSQDNYLFEFRSKETHTDGLYTETPKYYFWPAMSLDAFQQPIRVRANDQSAYIVFPQGDEPSKKIEFTFSEDKSSVLLSEEMRTIGFAKVDGEVFLDMLQQFNPQKQELPPIWEYTHYFFSTETDEDDEPRFQVLVAHDQANPAKGIVQILEKIDKVYENTQYTADLSTQIDQSRDSTARAIYVFSLGELIESHRSFSGNSIPAQMKFSSESIELKQIQLNPDHWPEEKKHFTEKGFRFKEAPLVWKFPVSDCEDRLDPKRDPKPNQRQSEE